MINFQKIKHIGADTESFPAKEKPIHQRKPSGQEKYQIQTGHAHIAPKMQKTAGHNLRLMQEEKRKGKMKY